ncbi:hypothetical protein CAPTEDRAFT_148613 [Capitella teleta]|uniref:carbonic anhydrase n=1 Tax=Capitella teleta TaxID=283909 RepID=R7TB34_CAPTE|nr:hypothetical protein CAPTEDRAFT_148613 [Capitella teleta]|eukprot:ELT88209.1 hypothetical protein CAPTEDRAFT_148613 [Capitella teleta]
MEFVHSFGFFTLLSLISPIDASDSWSYSGNTGPSYWVNSYATCGGSSQTPINLEGGEYDPNLGNITFTGYSAADSGTTYILENNGHTAKVGFQSSTSMSISDGGLSGTYKVLQFHAHWGRNGSGEGSEHYKDGKPYPAEIHIVHYRNSYADSTAAVDQPEGLAVLGIFLEQGSVENTKYSPFINALSNIPDSGQNFTMSGFALGDLLPSDTSKYFRYSGGLTTPPCYESIVWTVFNEPVSLSMTQMDALRTLNYEDGSTMQDNTRPLQNLNGRDITASWDGAHHVAVSFALILLVFVFHLF